MRKRPIVRFLLTLAATVAALALILCLVGWVMRPDLSARPPARSEDEIRQVRQAREALPDPANPLRLQVQVDYAQGPAAGWYPKGESPILAELVQQGKLPPVAERVGPEPVVYRGVDGIGRHGGTWVDGGLEPIGLSSRYSSSNLVRWSPWGDPVVPHVAKSWEISRDPATGKEDYRNFTFHLRKGMRWSDGTPFTAEDILYWWEHECNDPLVMGTIPPLMKIRGKVGTVQKLDAHTVRFSFPEPHGLFLSLLATHTHGGQICNTPKAYLQKFHPNPEVRRKAPDHDEALVKELMAIRRLTKAKDVYIYVKQPNNPEHPRLWPWLYRTYRPNPPYSYVRNPYYWMVDEAGNQLPYVDRIHSIAVSRELGEASVATGRFTMAIAKPKEYTLLMSGRQSGGYHIYRWLRADRSDAMIHVNINRRPEPGNVAERWKAKLLNTREFRQALSLAINRQTIIEANYYGETVAAQTAPGPESAFYHPRAHRNLIEHDPKRAEALLDSIGLTRRDSEGFRTAPDGTRLTFFLNHAAWLNPVTAQFITDDWNAVGVRTVPRMRDSRLFYTEKAALQHDFTMFTGENEFYPILEPRVFLPVSDESNFALGFARWYLRGGLYGDPLANDPGCIPVPADHPLRRGLTLYEQLKATGDRAEQKKLFDQIQDIAADNVWTIGLCTSPMYLVCVKDGFKNVPRLGAFTFTFISPGNTGLETFYFENGEHGPGVGESISREIQQVIPEPFSTTGVAKAKQAESAGWRWARRAGWLAVFGLVLLLAIKHPYVGRRLLIMVPTLLIVSVAVFTIIHLPPGDFLTSKIVELQMKGDQIDQQELDNIRQMYHLNEPLAKRYARWLGLMWFLPSPQAGEPWHHGWFAARNEGLLQGNLGRSMANDNKPVEQIVGDRVLLTVLISLGTILFTWMIALPVGVYSAVRQYSLGDYFWTFIGFIGMCVPSFLLALILMYLSKRWLNLDADRLFSPKFDLQPFWDWAKFIDLLKHAWVPVAILGIGGTAGMIRIMRGNLLDELKKPYVTTGRAKGVRPLKLLVKYPVRLALNPFVSGIGGIFPQLISGGALVSIVLNLPMIGPLMIDALRNSDTMLAGSMLMVLSILGIVGVLVSDLLLLWLDPRIRFKGGTR